MHAWEEEHRAEWKLNNGYLLRFHGLIATRGPESRSITTATEAISCGWAGARTMAMLTDVAD